MGVALNQAKLIGSSHKLAVLRMKYLCFLLLLVLSGCTTSVVVEGKVPTPLVAKLPLKVGVYYSPEFRKYRHEETIDQKGSFKIDFGAENLRFFRRLFSSMFQTVVELKQAPGNDEKIVDQIKAMGLDGVLVPEIQKYGFLTPDISGLNFYSASIRYHLVLIDATGKQVGNWGFVGYGKSEGGMFSGDKPLASATLQAIRDGGARIAIDIPRDPGFRAWVKAAGARKADSVPAGKKSAGNSTGNSSKSEQSVNPSSEGGR